VYKIYNYDKINILLYIYVVSILHFTAVMCSIQFVSEQLYF